MINKDFEGLCFTNLVDFDMVYGHRNNVDGYAKALSEFDSRLPEIIKNLRDEDLLMITADHGCDPGDKSTDHTREYVPFVAYSKKMKETGAIENQDTFGVIGATIVENFGVEMPEGTIGKSILKDLK